jgi:subtilase family serine protease
VGRADKQHRVRGRVGTLAGIVTGCAALAATAVAGGGVVTAAPSTAAAPAPLGFEAHPMLASVGHLGRLAEDSPAIGAAPDAAPTYGDCTGAGFHCYSPAQVRAVYGVTQLIRAGHEGQGQTIVIVDAYGTPTIAHDLDVFDKAYGLPNPTLHIDHPLGAPSYSKPGADEIGWYGETSLDVEWAHAMAPRATIDLLESKNDINSIKTFSTLETYAYDHHLGHVLTQSWGIAEEDLTGSASGRNLIAAYEKLYSRADAAGWSIFASSGDSGSDDGEYSYPTVNYPASSPLLTAVGGTKLIATSGGKWKSEVVWDDESDEGGAGGGGVSRYFSEPSYQKGLKSGPQSVLRGHRGVPDVSWDAAPETGIWTYCTANAGCSGFSKGNGFYGYNLVGGTSAGSPEWAGLTADVASAAGHTLGPLDTTLYRLGEERTGYHDIKSGTNAYGEVSGYRAEVGWDAASGWGTPDGALEPALIKAS